MQEKNSQEIAHELKGLEFVIDQIRQSGVGLRNDQHDLRISLKDAGAAAYDMMQFTKTILWRESPDRPKPQWEMLYTRQVIEEVLRLKIRKAEFLDVRLLVEYGSLRPILTDRLLLGRVCDLIIDNALTHSKGREVEIAQHVESEDGRRMFIDVRDHGSGIPDEDQERIFERNERVKGLTEGSGLGLYLAAHLGSPPGRRRGIGLEQVRQRFAVSYHSTLRRTRRTSFIGRADRFSPTDRATRLDNIWRARRVTRSRPTERFAPLGHCFGRRNSMRAISHIAGAALLICSLVVLTGCRGVFPPAFTTVSKISLQPVDPSHEGRYVIAQGENDNWSLRQRTERPDCAWFTLYDLDKDDVGNRIVALKTCHNRFVTVPRGDTTRPDTRWETRRDRMAWQENMPGDCARFTLESQGNDNYAFKTCGGRYLTAGIAGSGWAPPVDWAVIVENPIVQEWETFKVLPPLK